MWHTVQPTKHIYTDSPIWPNYGKRKGLVQRPTAASSEDLEPFLGRFQMKIHKYSPIFRSLRDIKRRYGTNDHVSEEFARRRSEYNFAQPQPLFRDQFEAIFGKIDDAIGGAFSEGVISKFLDLGCAPGGFSKYILDHNIDAEGLGITLPHIPMSVDGTSLAETRRYSVYEGDLTTVDFGCLPTSKSIQPKLEHREYDVIIAGAFATGLSHKTTPQERAILALSQLYAVLTNLQPNGTSVILATTKPFLWNVEIFAILRKVFRSVTPAKHKYLHAVRSSCYFVCTGFNQEISDAQLLENKVKCALNKLKGLDGAKADVTEWRDELLLLADQSNLTEFISTEVFQFLDLFEPIWKTQTNAIEKKLSQALRAT